ncbi:DUF2334 domain-containing protein [Flavobacterium sp. UBA6031]|uniref:DUF2334 domain-containing protein n=1 Tax=Flavobacterium sp. UBA6031 TaxID=1946551 RepID=UPI0025C6117C|nr:DUF2334 domain-containing protein [Flavobacterium sp. UBA6031]
MSNTNVCIRIDDVGNYDDLKCNFLIDTFIKYNIPVSCQVVPKWIDERFENKLAKEWLNKDTSIEWCQHGWEHYNHSENINRKFEFGDTRSKKNQQSDIVKGKNKLLEIFGDKFTFAFCPPHNRLNQTTIELLQELDYKYILGDTRTLQDYVLNDSIRFYEFIISKSLNLNGVRKIFTNKKLLQILEKYISKTDFVGICIHSYEFASLEECLVFVQALKLLQSQLKFSFKTISELC